MRILSFQTNAVRVPREPGPSAPHEAADYVTLKIRTDDGLQGIAYAGFASTIVTKGLKEVLDGLVNRIIGRDPFEIETIGSHLMSIAGGGSPAGLVTRAISAIDVALWDIKGKALGQPVWKLLGGNGPTVPVYASGYLWRHYDLDALASTAADLVSKGFRAMKFRMGAELSIRDEIARLRTMREAVGEDVDLMVDINQAWDVNRAILAGKEMAQYGLYWLEDPTNFADYAGLARIADALDTPIAAGEYHYGVAPFAQAIRSHSMDVVMVDLLRVGGITQWMKVAHMAEANNLPVVTHLAPEILAHALAASPNGLYVEHMPWTFPLFTEVPAINGDGRLVLPDSPGLGLDFDEDLLTSHAL